METKPNSRIKRLSTAIMRGYKIAQENGIKISRQEMIKHKKNGDIQCACALGLASIGLFGVKNPIKRESELMIHLYGEGNPTNTKLIGKTQNTMQSYNEGYIKYTVMALNDIKKKSPEYIANLLRSCGL